MLENLKKEVWEATKLISEYGLVTFSGGNVSMFDRKNELMVIKPSDTDTSDLQSIDMIVVDIEGNVIEGAKKPSGDFPTHLELYKKFQNISAIAHTHSPWATIFAQSGRSIKPYGTVHADYFRGTVPCTRRMTPNEIKCDYEREVANVIIESFNEIDYNDIPAVLVHSNGPFVWSDTAINSVKLAKRLEDTAMMAYHTEIMQGVRIQDDLLNKHFTRRHIKK